MFGWAGRGGGVDAGFGGRAIGLSDRIRVRFGTAAIGSGVAAGRFGFKDIGAERFLGLWPA